MPLDRYFDKFPIINYSNNNIVDITKRVTTLDRVSRNPYAFYPYDITSDERPDQFSARYYGDAFKTWMIYLANNIADPYYEWYMSEREFLEFIELKYGSIYNAQQKIKYYRNNWENQENISVSGYNALADNMKKYWEPNYSSGSSIISYSRKQIDWTASTNKVMSYTVANTAFMHDEIVDIYLDGKSKGRGQVVSCSEVDMIHVQHLSGYYQESDTLSINNGYIYGTESQVNTAVTMAELVTTNIPQEEYVYWKAYSYYDYEYEKNEYNRSIRVIDSSLSETAVNNLTELLSE